MINAADCMNPTFDPAPVPCPSPRLAPAAGGRAVAAPVALSLCMIVRDEEARLRECLESVRPYVDEMVVVDTGSRDRTHEIAHACGARVFEFPWCDDFAAARNASLRVAQGRSIFWMDADDVLDPACGRRLRPLADGRPHEAFSMQVVIPPGPTEFSPQAVDHVKLFPNRPYLRFEHRIHEQILPSLRRAEIPVHATDLYVTHRNYDRSPEGQEKKRRRDFRLLELDLRDRPEHPFTLFNLGMTYLYATHEYEVAAQYLHRSLDRSNPADSIVRKAYAMLVQCRLGLGEWDAALAANEAGRRLYPDDAELLFQAGDIYRELRRWDEARSCLERLIAGREETHYRSVDVGLRTYRARHELALLFRRLGDAPHCAELLREVAEAHPEYLPAQLDLAETALRLGDRATAGKLLTHLEGAVSLRPQVNRLWGMLRAA